MQWYYRVILGVGVMLAPGCRAAPPARPAPDGLTAARLRVLEPALHHPTPEMRRKTVMAVGAQGATAGDVLLEGLVQEDDASVRYQYVQELRRAPGADVRAALAALASDDDESDGVRLAAVQSLTAHGPEAGAELARVAAQSGGVGRAARLALMLTGGAAALEFFRAEALRSGIGPALRRELIAGLCRVAQPADLDLLRALTEDRDAVVRRHAARALGRLGDPADRGRLVTLSTRDRSDAVRRTARIALYRLAAR